MCLLQHSMLCRALPLAWHACQRPLLLSFSNPLQVDFFDPVAKGDKGAPSGLAALCGPAESSAVEAAAEQMLDLQKAAGEAEVAQCWHAVLCTL